MPSSDTAATVQELNQGWRNYICDAMKLNRDTFQLAQGSLGLQTADSSGLFLMADAVPPATSVGYYDATSMNKRSSNYLGLLDALLPETAANGLQTALGDGYASWIAWKTANPPQAGETALTYFQRFELSSTLDQGALTRGEAAILAAKNSALIRAWTAYNNPAFQTTFSTSTGTSYTLPTYTTTISNAISQINQGGSLTIDFDSSSMDTSSSSTFIEGSADGFFDIFSGGASGSFSKQSSMAAASKFTISGTINRYATLPSSAGSWYSSDEVIRAFNAKNDMSVWDPNASAGGWDNFFGDTGGLARYVSQLVLVSDYSITVTSHADYSQDDFQQIQAQASGGIWPFFSASGSGTQTTSSALNSDSTLSVTQTLQKGLIQIWGVTVQPAP
jgi:hypothetical protein